MIGAQAVVAEGVFHQVGGDPHEQYARVLDRFGGWPADETQMGVMSDVIGVVRAEVAAHRLSLSDEVRAPGGVLLRSPFSLVIGRERGGSARRRRAISPLSLFGRTV